MEKTVPVAQAMIDEAVLPERVQEALGQLGIELHGYTNIVALGIATGGDKLALGLWDGSTENATVAAALLSDLVERGLDGAPPSHLEEHVKRHRKMLLDRHRKMSVGGGV